jgi:hypothetical protein
MWRKLFLRAWFSSNFHYSLWIVNPNATSFLSHCIFNLTHWESIPALNENSALGLCSQFRNKNFQLHVTYKTPNLTYNETISPSPGLSLFGAGTLQWGRGGFSALLTFSSFPHCSPTTISPNSWFLLQKYGVWSVVRVERWGVINCSYLVEWLCTLWA